MNEREGELLAGVACLDCPRRYWFNDGSQNIFSAVGNRTAALRHSQAQATGKVFKIGLLLAASEPNPEFRANEEALRTGFRDLGWTEGKNLVIETRWGGIEPQRLLASSRPNPLRSRSLLSLRPGTISIRAAR